MSGRGSKPADGAEEGPRPRGWRPAGWALGLPAVVFLVGLAAVTVGRDVEREIRRATLALAGQGGASALARYQARAEVEGRDVVVIADADSAAELDSGTAQRIAALPGVRRVRTEIAPTIALQPYPFAVRRDASGLRLTGGVPSAAGRAALVEQAARIVGPDRVDDRLRLATGEPPGFGGAAAFLIDLVGRTESGDATLSDRRFEIRVEAGDSAAYDALILALRQPPSGYVAGEVDVVPPIARPFLWSMRRDRSAIVLTGHVRSEAERATIAAAAAATAPETPIRDEMRTARGLPSGVDLPAVTRALGPVLAASESGEVVLSGRRFDVAVDTVAKADIAEIEARVRRAMAAPLELGTLKITVVPASPYTFSARRAGGRVTLGGFLPDEDSRKILARLLAARYPGETVLDGARLADGAPDGFAETSRLALETLSEFASGEAVLRDRDLRLSGRILYAQLAARTRRSFGKTVPAGWTSSLALEPPVPERALDPMMCGDLLADAGRKAPIRFAPGKATLAPPSEAALEATADIVRRCGTVAIRVVHHAPASDPPDAARELAVQRAGIVVTALGERGATARLSGDGAVLPRPANGVAPGDPGGQTELRLVSP